MTSGKKQDSEVKNGEIFEDHLRIELIIMRTTIIVRNFHMLCMMLLWKLHLFYHFSLWICSSL